MSTRLDSEQNGQGRATRGVVRLVIGVAGMFGFAFALVPLYDALCDLTGLNGKTGGQYEYVAAEASVDLARDVKIRFMATNNQGMAWEFRPVAGAQGIHPGAVNTAMFYARNPTNRTIVGQAIPSVAPARAAEFFHKTECFCFENQVLGPGEAIEMPVRFIVDRELPDSVQSITLSYTMFDVTDRVSLRPAVTKEQSPKKG